MSKGTKVFSQPGELGRLRLHGLIERVPGTKTNTRTPGGIRVAVFYTKPDRYTNSPEKVLARSSSAWSMRWRLTSTK